MQLGNLVTFKTGKLDSNAAVPGGEYPFFTCAKETYQIDKFAFDTECVLLAGNNANGVFSIKYYSGKFNAYQRTYIIEPKNREELSTNFLYYALQLKLRLLQGHSAGTATKYLTLPILNELQIDVLDFGIQNNITSILSAYDELIENNNRRIALLEESMRLLYREWFVRLRFPGYEHVRVVDGLPEGWEKTKLRDVTSYINRGVSPKYGDSDNRWVLNQKCVREGRLNTLLARKHITEYSIDKGVKFGDVLVNSTGIGTLGRVAQVYEELENYTVDSHITIVRPNERVEIDFFGLFLLGLQSYFDQMGAGSTGQTELSRDSIANAFFILPTIEVQKEFGNYVSSKRQMIQNLLTQNKKLSEARDLLLPRLMSGEIEVS